MQVRQQIAHNAGYASYRDYRWRQMLRFDYTPGNSKAFHSLIERVLLPTSKRIWERRRKLLGVEQLRPWDMFVDGRASEPPRHISDVETLLRQSATVFRLIDPRLGSYFDTMLQEQLLDLEERPDKALGGFNQPLEVRHRPFVLVMLTLSGRLCVRSFTKPVMPSTSSRQLRSLTSTNARRMPSRWNLPRWRPRAWNLSELCILSRQDHAPDMSSLAAHTHLENMLANYLPEFILDDAFQHWIYEHPEQATDPQQCNQKWAELSRLYQPAIDWSGLETELG